MSSSSEPQVFSRDNLPMLLILMACGALTSVTGGLVAPVFPEAAAQLQLDEQWYGVLVSMHTLTIAIFSPILGLLADRIGKLRVLIPALLGYAIFGAMGGLSQGFTSLLISRALVGAASGGIAAAGIGFLGGMFTGTARSRAMGYATSALASAGVVFPIVGGLLGAIHWRLAFSGYVVGVPIAIAALLILRSVRPTQIGGAANLSQVKGIGKTLRQPSVAILCLTLGLTSAIFYVVVVYAPKYFYGVFTLDLGMSGGNATAINGGILAARAVGAALISAIGSSRLAQRLGVAPALAIGFGLMAVTLFSIPVLVQPAAALAAAFVFGLGFGIVMPNLYSGLSNLATARHQSGVMAIGTGCSSLGQFLSPLCLGPVWKDHTVAVFYIGAGVAIAVGILSLLKGEPQAATD